MSQQPAKRFAAFDIDGTLVRWQFFHAIVHQLGKQHLLGDDIHSQIGHARMHWKQREHAESFRVYENTLVQAYFAALGHISEADHAAVIQAVFDEYKDQLFTYTRDLLRDLKSQGYTIFAISGSHQAILQKLAEHVGIDDFVGATFEFKDGAYTGNVTSPIEDKAAALKRLAGKHSIGFEGSLAIGDSESDIAMLELVEQPIAFNPSHGLYEYAKSMGWKIVVERKNTIYELERTSGTYILA